MDTLLTDKLQQNARAIQDFLVELEQVFNGMDEKYNEVAGQYGFVCTGCRDNCCLTRFYHHTVLEYAFLKKGFDTLPGREKETIQKKAARVNADHKKADLEGRKIRIMCPINTNGMCDLYRFRPMICRMHGIPHELISPNGLVRKGPGCDAFDKACGTSTYIPFDRTPFYMALSLLEKGLREQLAYPDKIKMTIAEILASFTAKHNR